MLGWVFAGTPFWPPELREVSGMPRCSIDMVGKVALVCFAVWAMASTDFPARQYAEIRVLDAQTGRGVPLVELETVHHVRFVTDNAGRVAIAEPDLLDREVFFSRFAVTAMRFRQMGLVTGECVCSFALGRKWKYESSADRSRNDYADSLAKGCIGTVCCWAIGCLAQ
jgi:hypothetical protein